MQDRDGTVYYGESPLPGTMNLFMTYLCPRKTKYYYIGASVIIPQDTFNQIGGWNENIFMYGEDADLFFRINRKNNNYKIAIDNLSLWRWLKQ